MTDEARLGGSKKLLTSLYDLRRARGKEAESGEGGPSRPELLALAAWCPAEVNSGKIRSAEEPLLLSTLRDIKDTEAQLRIVEKGLLGAHGPVHESGGARHASAIVSVRSLAVVRRKAELIAAVEHRTDRFQMLHARREQLYEEVLARPSCSIPDDLLGVKGFLATHVHQDGDPVDADKHDFEMFVSTFGLPASHHAVVRLRDLASEASDWWTRAAQRAAAAGAESSAIQRLMRIAEGITSEGTNPAMQDCLDMLGDRLAEEVQAAAEQLQARDEELAAQGGSPRPDSALEASRTIHREIKRVISQGALSHHPALEQAREIAAALFFQGKSRLALQALHRAKKIQQRDAACVADLEPDAVPPVGPASRAADEVEREVRSAEAAGALGGHAALKEALAIAKALRDEESHRRWIAALSRRASAQALRYGRGEVQRLPCS